MREQRYCKRLIEVDLPIKKISEHACREKSIRHGHISTLHIWWARRPLAACRAVICAALWPDPVDLLCPDKFKNEAARLMKEFRNKRGGQLRNWDDPQELRYALLDFIADFSNWDNSTVKEFLITSRKLTQIAHESLGGMPGTKPFLVDTFAGGGSIPLEASRVGTDVFASDLNPVPVLLNKVNLEYIPKYGQDLADEVRKWGEWIKGEAEKELLEFYPKDRDSGAKPIAYLWARTIKCEGPDCGAEVPLMRSLWLVKSGNRSIKLRIVPNRSQRCIDFSIDMAPGKNLDELNGTSKRGSATCPCCGYTTPVASVRKQLNLRNGGAADARLVAIREDDPKKGGRSWRLPNKDDLTAVSLAKKELAKREIANRSPLSLIPNETLPIMSGVFNAPLYGHSTWGSLFSQRQALAISVFSDLVKSAQIKMSKAKLDEGLIEAVTTCLALVVDRLADFNSSLCVLNSVGGRGVVHTFGRQALPMIWDFMETNPFNEAGANWNAGLNAFDMTIAFEKTNLDVGQAVLCSATKHPLPDNSVDAFITDPPYYNAVPYADLSDFFYVWLRRTLSGIHSSLLDGNLSPKEDEVCEMAGWDPVRYKHKDSNWFESMMSKAMNEGRRILKPDGICIIVFAHKTTSGWEALLQAMIDAGWMITGSWPIDTEMPGRLRAHNSAALASSIHLVCRPRKNLDRSLHDDDVGDWRDVLQELPRRIHEWMPRLAQEGVVGADAIFACLGPALEVYSKYSRVEKASGDKVELREYLEQVWGAVAKEALNMIFQGAHTEEFEEDTRLTAIWLWTLSTNGNESIGSMMNEGNESQEDVESSKSLKLSGFTMEYDAARKISQGLGAHLEKLESVIEIMGENARLLPVSERVKYLFGKGTSATIHERKKKKEIQKTLFEEFNKVEEQGWSFGEEKSSVGKTVLDRLHQAMILFGAGRSDAMRRFLEEEGIGKDERFWRLAQALSALYPSHTDEKRWVDGVLARKKSLGF